MNSRRLQRAAEAIRGVVSMAILQELKDPRVRDVTVTHVEVSPDMRHAKVHVSVMGDDVRQRLSLVGLRSSAGFLQAKIAERIDTRYTPKLQFELDQGVKKSIELIKLLKQVLPDETAPATDEAAGEYFVDEDELPGDELPGGDESDDNESENGESDSDDGRNRTGSS
jgi:ribosome-binding factor A